MEADVRHILARKPNNFLRGLDAMVCSLLLIARASFASMRRCATPNISTPLSLQMATGAASMGGAPKKRKESARVPERRQKVDIAKVLASFTAVHSLAFETICHKWRKRCVTTQR